MNRTEYIGKLNALYVGEKNCLEELITAYDEKDKEIERLHIIIEESIKLTSKVNKMEAARDLYDLVVDIKNKLKEVKKSEI